MREPGFQMYTEDPPPPERVPFNVALYKDGTFLDRFPVDTGYTDGAIRGLVESWVGKYKLSEEDVKRLVQQFIRERDARRPR